MPDTPNQPKEYDAVLGSLITPPANAAVLGGLEAVKKRLASQVIQQQIVALSEAMKYGQLGTDLVIQTLKSESQQLHKTAYHLLRQKIQDSKIKEALWDYNPYRFFECLATLDGHLESAVASVATSTDGKTLVSGGAFHNPTVKVWDLHSQQEIRTLGKHSNRVETVIISPDGQTLVSAGDDIKVWNLQTGREIHTLKGVSGATAIAVSLDWQILFSGNWDGTITLWDLQAGKVIRTVEAHRGSISCLLLSADGQTIFSGGASRIKIWDIKTMREISNILAHSNSLTSLALNSNGQTLASGSRKEIKLWNWQKGEEIDTINGHLGYVLSLVFSPDEQTLISSGNSDDNQIKFWNLQTKKTICTLKGHRCGINITLSADGHTLVSGSEDIKIWGVR